MIWPFSRRAKMPPDAHRFRLYDELDAAAFRDHPIWLYVHLHDFGNPVYENCDEEAMRPWPDSYPAPVNAICDVAARFITADGREAAGCISLTKCGKPLSQPVMDHSPQLFLPSGHKVRFWHGSVYLFGDQFLLRDKSAFYRELGVSPDTAFPLTYAVPDSIVVGGVSGVIPGFGFFASNDVTTFTT